jgi:hypothetical protein
MMTDGENTYYMDSGDTTDLNGADYYAPYGWPTNRTTPGDDPRLGDGTQNVAAMEDLVDEQLLATCTAMKDDNIEIFTIGLEPPNDDVRDMLRACATDHDHAYFPASSSELTSVFESIALQLADLRLSL